MRAIDFGELKVKNVKKDNIWQLPFLEDNSCVVCGNIINENKMCVLAIDVPGGNYKSYYCNTPYCRNCRLPYANTDVSRRVRRKTGHFLKIFFPKKNCSAESIRNQMKYHRKNNLNLNFARENNKGYERVPTNEIIWKTSKFLCSQLENSNECPKCHIELQTDYTLIPVSKYEKAKIPGKLCCSCGTIYVKKSQELIKIMRDNPLSKGFTLDGRELWNASIIEARKERRRRLYETANSVVMLCIKTCNQVREYIITTGITNDPNIFCYKSIEGRELLSAAFAEERARKGILFEKEFQILEIVFAKKHFTKLPNYILPVELTIEADGGYITSVKNCNHELADILVYSPLTQRYELMRGTYDKEKNYCYTDISIFRRFVHAYGKPRISFDFNTDYSGGYSNYDLRSESVLMLFGYSVSEANCLSAEERHDILAEIVDLEILTVHRIVKLLDFHCRLHSGERYWLARSKWISDKDFIENYKVNPNRFLIAHTTK